MGWFSKKYEVRSDPEPRPMAHDWTHPEAEKAGRAEQRSQLERNPTYRDWRGE